MLSWVWAILASKADPGWFKHGRGGRWRPLNKGHSQWGGSGCRCGLLGALVRRSSAVESSPSICGATLNDAIKHQAFLNRVAG